MLEIEGLTKRFGKKAALDHMTCHIENGSIFGLVGSNGSGKSTLLRTIAGIYQPDGGTVKWNGMPTFEHVACKGSMFFVPDFPYFFYQATIYRIFIRNYTRGGIPLGLRNYVGCSHWKRICAFPVCRKGCSGRRR